MEIPTALTGEKPKITVYLSNKYSNEQKFFHCTICGHKVFGYFSDQKILLAGEGEFVKAPISLPCNGAITLEKNGQTFTTRCKSIYYVA